MNIPVVFLDANILYSRTLCDWIFMLRLEASGMIRLFSSADVLDEVAYNLRRALPQADGSLIQRKRDRMRMFLDDVIVDFAGDVPFAGKDVHDAHVHAAAVGAGASYLVTDDRGFHALSEDDAPYETHTADSFLCLVAENSPHAVQAVIMRQLGYSASRSEARKPLGDALRDAGCPEFARRIEAALRAVSDGRSVVTALDPAATMP